MTRSLPCVLAASLFSVARVSAQVPVQEAELSHPAPVSDDAFGYDVDISADGSRVVVGAPNDDTTAGVNAGTAYVFFRTGTGWALEATLAPEGPGPAANQQFGVAVAMSADGTRIAVGRPGAGAIPTGDPQGGVDVFVRVDAGWVHEAFIAGVMPMFEAVGRFGVALDLDAAATTLVVGAPGMSHQGNASIFTRSGSAWTLAQDLASVGGFFGAQVAVSGDASRIAVAFPTGDSAAGADSGGANIYRRMGALWVEEQSVLPSFAGLADLCFDSLVFDETGTRLFGGCVFDGGGTVPGRGAVGVFVRSGMTWSEEAVLRPADAERDDRTGNGVAVTPDGMRALVGMYGDQTFPTPGSHGSVRVFDRVGGSWTEVAVARPPVLSGGFNLGLSVAIVDDGSRFVAGAPGDGTPGDDLYNSARVFTLGADVPVDAGVADAGEGDSGVADAGGDDAGAVDAGNVDAGVALDASLPPDAPVAALDAGGDAGVSPSAGGGCGCTVGDGRGGSAPVAIVALLFAVVARRRAARRRVGGASAQPTSTCTLSRDGGVVAAR